MNKEENKNYIYWEFLRKIKIKKHKMKSKGDGGWWQEYVKKKLKHNGKNKQGFSVFIYASSER